MKRRHLERIGKPLLDTVAQHQSINHEIEVTRGFPSEIDAAT
jgi:hypothetical protein